MSAISTAAQRQNEANARIDAAISGLTEDVQGLKDKIQELQNSPGSITPEDQALLDELVVRAESIATKLQALDDTTAPVYPVV